MRKNLKHEIRHFARQQYILAAGVAIVLLWSSHLQAQSNCGPAGSMSIESSPVCSGSIWIGGYFPSTCWSAAGVNSVTLGTGGQKHGWVLLMRLELFRCAQSSWLYFRHSC